MSSFTTKAETIPAGNHKFTIRLYQEKPFVSFQVDAFFDSCRVFKRTYTTRKAAERAYQREHKRLAEETGH